MQSGAARTKSPGLTATIIFERRRSLATYPHSSVIACPEAGESFLAQKKNTGFEFRPGVRSLRISFASLPGTYA